MVRGDEFAAIVFATRVRATGRGIGIVMSCLEGTGVVGSVVKSGCLHEVDVGDRQWV